MQSPLVVSATQLIESGRTEEAEILFKQRLEENPEDKEVLFQLASMLSSLGRAQEAVDYYRCILSFAPDEIDVHHALGSLFREHGNHEAALACFRHAHELGDASLQLHRNMGDALLDNGDPAGALLSYQHALALKPHSAPTLGLIGEAHRALNQNVEAIAAYRQALEIDPAFTHVQWALAFALLLMGDYATGLPLNEKRFNFESREFLAALGIWPNIEKFSSKPSWDGGDLKGINLLVWTEQGMGDNIMMMRYLPLLKERGAKSITVVCHDALLNIVRPLVDQATSQRDPVYLELFDLHCSSMSLPYLFGTSLETIPRHLPYLKLATAATQRWEIKMENVDGLKVGIVWAGNKGMAKDHLRSLDLARLAPLMGIEGVQFVSLQTGDAARQIRETGWPILDWMQDAPDFSDTAALIANLDLVISVDTAVAHLAGALGKPVWLLNRFESEWRWMTEREDSPWYPTMRIFRQPALHDWTTVVHQVAAHLEQAVTTGKSKGRKAARDHATRSVSGFIKRLWKRER